MNNSLTPEPADFDDPIGLLKACHQRMLEHCKILEKLVAHIAAQGLDDEARSAINRVLNYFSISAVHHHQDEEQDLFPVLARQSLKLADRVHELRKQHEQISASWDELQASLRTPATLAENPAFEDQVTTFCEQYRSHIDFEEKELLTMAQHILSHEELVVFGDNMAKRRSVSR